MLIKLGTKTQFYIKMIIENHIKGEEKMSKLSRKLVLSVLTLVLSVVALGTTTFAWFALGQSAEIQAFELQATAGEGLEIALYTGTKATDEATYGALDWRTSYKGSDVEALILSKYFKNAQNSAGEVINDADEPLVENSADSGDWYLKSDGTTPATPKLVLALELDAVTSPNGIAIKDRGVNLADSTDAADVNKYLELNISFRSTSAGSVYWNNAALSSTALAFTNSLANNAWIGLDSVGVPNGQNTVSYFLHHAVRVSIEKTDATSVIYEHREYETDGTPKAFNINDYNNIILGDGTGLDRNGAHSYFEAKTGTSLTAVAGDPLAVTRQNSVEVNKIGDTDNAKDLGTLAAAINFNSNNYHTLTVTLRVWIEGWDQNAFDAIYKQVLQIALGFEKRQ